MNITEAIKVVQFLHASYPSDKKANNSDLAQRAQLYSVTFADYDFDTVIRAAQHCVNTSKFYPSTSELLKAVSYIRVTNVPVQAPETARVTPIDEAVIEEYVDAFCEWIGFGCEENDNKELPDLPKGVLPYDN